jgi:hypothetical protein
VFASAYWALLPLLARNQVGGGPALYGMLLGAIGTGSSSEWSKRGGPPHCRQNAAFFRYLVARRELRCGSGTA